MLPIDALRSVIEQFEDKHTKNVLLTVLMSVMSAAASTTTHFAQFLKVKSKSTCNNLLSKRKINIIEECKALLKEYRKVGLCSKEEHEMLDCYNLDFLNAWTLLLWITVLWYMLIRPISKNTIPDTIMC